jgi:hypothetical protein
MAMKLFAAIIALVLQGAIVTPAIPAEYPMTQAHCEKAGSEVKKKRRTNASRLCALLA